MKNNKTKKYSINSLNLNKNSFHVLDSSEKNLSTFNNIESKKIKNKTKSKDKKDINIVRDFKLNYLRKNSNDNKINSILQYNSTNNLLTNDKKQFKTIKNKERRGSNLLPNETNYFSFCSYFINIKNIDFQNIESIKYFNYLTTRIEIVNSLLKKKPKYDKKIIYNLEVTNKKVFIIGLFNSLLFMEQSIPGKSYNFFVNIKKGNILSKYGIIIRPYFKEFLLKLLENGEVIIFTKEKEYVAKKVLKKITELFEVTFKHVLYQEYCGKIGGEVIKDPTIIKNLDIKNMIFFDYDILNFMFHFYNGFPITSYNGKQKNDKELKYLSNIIDEIVNSDNIQLLLKDKINLFNIIQLKEHKKILDYIKSKIIIN